MTPSFYIFSSTLIYTIGSADKFSNFLNNIILSFWIKYRNQALSENFIDADRL